MSLGSREQLIAFVILVLAVMVLGLTPIVTAGIMGKTLPDSLIAVSDKTVTGLIGVLGSVATMIFRTNRADEIRAENTGKAFTAITATAAAPGEVQNVNVVNPPDDPANVKDTKEEPKP